MKSVIVSLLFAALLVAAQTETVSKVPNYYYDSESSSFAYCTSADASKSGCKCIEANMIYVNGYCVANDEEHMCGEITPSMTTQTSCGDFGSTVDYCGATADNEVSLVHSEGCFNNEDLDYGVAAIYTKISFTNMPVFGINAAAKAKIISGLVASFPFMISDVDFGSIYLSSESTIDKAPITIVEARIITRINNIPSFEAAEDNLNEDSPANIFTAYLHMYADTLFSPCVEASFELMESYKHDIVCVGENGSNYSLGDYEYDVCSIPVYNGNAYSYSSRVCTAENGGTWSEPNTSNCVDPNIIDDKQYVIVDMSLLNIPYTLMNSNMTKALYPIFIKMANTDIRNIQIMNAHPYFSTKDDVSTIDMSSTGLMVIMTMEKNCMSHISSSYPCSAFVLEQFSYTVNIARIGQEIKEIDPVKFKNLVFSYTVYTD